MHWLACDTTGQTRPGKGHAYLAAVGVVQILIFLVISLKQMLRSSKVI